MDILRSMSSHPPPPLVRDVLCKRLGLTQDGAPEMSIFILIYENTGV